MNTLIRTRRIAVAVVAAAVLPLSLAACGSDGGSGKTEAGSAGSAKPAAEPAQTPSESPDAMSEPFGPGCAAVPKEGAGSFEGMAKEPVATAASNNPDLSTLVAAVKAAGLVDTLNNAKDITVFAPTNQAFAKIPKADLAKVLADKEQLTKILTYHVVDQRLTPEQLEKGTFTTMEGSELTTQGSGEEFTVNDSAKVVCGNVPTANATVYVIDTVLMPPQ